MSVYGYENFHAQLPRVVTIHTSGCGQCNDGKGMEGKSDPADGKWHGPFSSVEAAHRKLDSLSGVGRAVHHCVVSKSE